MKQFLPTMFLAATLAAAQQAPAPKDAPAQTPTSTPSQTKAATPAPAPATEDRELDSHLSTMRIELEEEVVLSYNEAMAAKAEADKADAAKATLAAAQERFNAANARYVAGQSQISKDCGGTLTARQKLDEQGHPVPNRAHWVCVVPKASEPVKPTK